MHVHLFVQPSYIFQSRPLTPPKVIRQQEYGKELSKQVDVKDSTRKRTREEQELLDRLEQAQRAEELAAQRERFLRNKVDSQNGYKHALGLSFSFLSFPLLLPINFHILFDLLMDL